MYLNNQNTITLRVKNSKALISTIINNIRQDVAYFVNSNDGCELKPIYSNNSQSKVDGIIEHIQSLAKYQELAKMELSEIQDLVNNN